MNQSVTTQPDLFSSVKSKKEQLLAYIRFKGRCRTSEVMRWGLDNYHTRADRDARQLAIEGKIWRVRDEIARMIIGETKEEIWSVYPADK